MRYRYDNTSENPHNPSTPPRRVVFGSETSDEMGELLVQVLPKKPADTVVLKAQVARKNLLTDVAGEEKRLADVPGDYETHNALGVAYSQLGRHQDARAQFDAALALAPQHPGTHYNLGVIAMGVQRYADAIDHFQRTLASRPDHAVRRGDVDDAAGAALEHAAAEDLAGQERARDVDVQHAAEPLDRVRLETAVAAGRCRAWTSTSAWTAVGTPYTRVVAFHVRTTRSRATASSSVTCLTRPEGAATIWSRTRRSWSHRRSTTASSIVVLS